MRNDFFIITFMNVIVEKLLTIFNLINILHERNNFAYLLKFFIIFIIE